MNSIPSSAPAVPAATNADAFPAPADPAITGTAAAAFIDFFTAAAIPAGGAAAAGTTLPATSASADQAAPAETDGTPGAPRRPPPSSSLAGATAWCLFVTSPTPAPPASPPPAVDGGGTESATAPTPAPASADHSPSLSTADAHETLQSAASAIAIAQAVARPIEPAAEAAATPTADAIAGPALPAEAPLPSVADPSFAALAGRPTLPQPVQDIVLAAGAPAPVIATEAAARIRRGGRASTGEKIAPSSPAKAPETGPAASAPRTSPDLDGILESAPQAVKRGRGAVGIDRAEAPSAMSRPAAAPVPAPAARAAVGGSAETLPSPVVPVDAARAGQAEAASGPQAPDAPASAPTATQHAVAAVESALDCIAHVRETGRPSVALDLSFADQTRLAVRIELRDGTVHTIFRTDSAELRQALSHEWSLAAPAAHAADGERTVRIAEPVFAPATGSPAAGGSATGGGAHARQMPAEVPVARPAAPITSAARRDAPAEPAPVPALRPATSVRLHAFA